MQDTFILVKNVGTLRRGIPAGHVVVDATRAVGKWIEEQPIHMWKFDTIPADQALMMDRYVMSERLYTLLVLRWS